MKTIALLIGLLFPIIYLAQPRDDDDKRYCFEPVFGTYKMFHQYKSEGDILTNSNSIGYKFGLLKNIGIGRTFVIRPQVAFGWNKRQLTLKDIDLGEQTIYNGADFMIHSSLHFSQNFTNGSKKNFLYLIEGGTYSLNMMYQNGASKLWNENDYTMSVDLGAGVRFYNNRKHILAMELIYSFGVIDRKFYGDNSFEETFDRNYSQDVYSKIKSIYSHCLTLQILL